MCELGMSVRKNIQKSTNQYGDGAFSEEYMSPISSFQIFVIGILQNIIY